VLSDGLPVLWGNPGVGWRGDRDRVEPVRDRRINLVAGVEPSACIGNQYSTRLVLGFSTRVQY